MNKLTCQYVSVHILTMVIADAIIFVSMHIDTLRPSPEKGAPAKFGVVDQDGIIPEKAYMTTNQIEFFKDGEEWQLPTQPRMDGVVRRTQRSDGSEGLEVVEGNKLHVGDQVVMATSENEKEGVYVAKFVETPWHTDTSMAHHASMEFNTTEVSRERIINYAHIANLLEEAKEKPGKVVWVLGPAVVHAGGIKDMAWLVKNGYVGALFGGNAVAAHDIEHAMLGTSLGVNDDSEAVHNGHRNHLETINRIRRVGKIKDAVDRGLVKEGIMYECIKNNVPFVLAGSIRDDGPLPDTIPSVLDSQNAMREYTKDASAIVMVATALHSIATGNMTPTYRVDGDEINPIPVICVDSDEFVVNKLSDRGTSQATAVIGNAADFLARVVVELKKIQSNKRRRKNNPPDDISPAAR